MAARRKNSIAIQDGKPLPLPLDRYLWNAVAQTLALSPQQTRIAEMILRGKQDKEIAAELNLSVPTVRTYLKRIFDRLGVSDRVGLILRVFALAQESTACPKCHRER
jgi:DNA-binding NarL/FixJ family response regulator